MRIAWVLLLLYASAAAADERLRCAAGDVAAPMTAAEVLAACGEPLLKDRLGAVPASADYDEEWLYNFGPRQPLRILRLREGQLRQIEGDGYGYVRAPDLSCEFQNLKAPMSKFRLLLACGTPPRRETLAAWRADAARPVLRERWHYNAAGGERIRTVTLENGRIVNVEEKKSRTRY